MSSRCLGRLDADSCCIGLCRARVVRDDAGRLRLRDRERALLELVRVFHGFHRGQAIDQIVGWFLAGLVLAAIVRPVTAKPVNSSWGDSHA